MQEITKAVVLVAGLGTRLLPATKAIAKEMVPIVDKPAVQIIVEELVASGITDIVFITSRGKHAIEDHFDKHPELNACLIDRGKTDLCRQLQQLEDAANYFFVRQQEPLGTGHAVLQAHKHIGDQPFVLAFGDDLVRAKVPATKQLIEEALKNDAPVLAAQEVPDTEISRYGIFKLKKGTHQLETMVEKPSIEEAPSNLASYGRFVLTPDIWKHIKNLKADPTSKEIYLTGAINALSKERPVLVKKVDGEWVTTGDPVRYLKTVIKYALDRNEFRHEILSFLKEVVTKHA